MLFLFLWKLFKVIEKPKNCQWTERPQGKISTLTSFLTRQDPSHAEADSHKTKIKIISNTAKMNLKWCGIHCLLLLKILVSWVFVLMWYYPCKFFVFIKQKNHKISRNSRLQKFGDTLRNTWIVKTYALTLHTRIINWLGQE